MRIAQEALVYLIFLRSVTRIEFERNETARKEKVMKLSGAMQKMLNDWG